MPEVVEQLAISESLLLGSLFFFFLSLTLFPHWMSSRPTKIGGILLESPGWHCPKSVIHALRNQIPCKAHDFVRFFFISFFWCTLHQYKVGLMRESLLSQGRGQKVWAVRKADLLDAFIIFDSPLFQSGFALSGRVWHHWPWTLSECEEATGFGASLASGHFLWFPF